MENRQWMKKKEGAERRLSDIKEFISAGFGAKHRAAAASGEKYRWKTWTEDLAKMRSEEETLRALIEQADAALHEEKIVVPKKTPTQRKKREDVRKAG
jgi:heme oxygenase